jgi:(S)-2-hydroxyglutarate dehydrogenase
MDEDKGSRSRHYDIIIVGAGVLGISTSFWLSQNYSASVCLLDMEEQPASHTTSRNTGVIHRPFYLNPSKKKVFAATAQKSYYLWYQLASEYDLPWRQVGTLELAKREDDVDTLNQYKKWGLENGMDEGEIEILDSTGTKKMEANVNSLGAIFSMTDTAVDYAQFSNALLKFVIKNGTEFLARHKVIGIKETGKGAEVTARDETGNVARFECGTLINAAGGASLDIAHSLGLAKKYTDLHFRGDYWIVDSVFGSRITHNIYAVPRYKEFPFLDPHFIVRANGTHEIGPNATLVTGPFVYRGMSSSAREFIAKIFERPVLPKLKLFTNRKFLSLAWNERNSSSKDEMCRRVREFIPALSTSFLNNKGLAGVRSSLIDENGFVPEAVEIEGASSFHILNYNSPGATGAPAYSAYLVNRMKEGGFLDGFTRKDRKELWNFEVASNLEILSREGNLRTIPG